MTLYLVDISKYQAGLSIAEVKSEGFSAVLARSSTGYDGGSKGGQFATFSSQATTAGILVGAYHFLYPHGQVTIKHQADVCASAIGDTSIPVMVDHEPDGSGAPTPSVTDALDFANSMRSHGYRVPLWYLPHWVWQDHLGSPKLPTDTGMRLVSSDYVSGSGYASTLYPGDNGAGWDAYGGQTPVIWQFTDAAKVAGQLVDADAYKGSLSELTTLFTEEGEMDYDTFKKYMDRWVAESAVWGDVTDTSGTTANRTFKWMTGSLHNLTMTLWRRSGPSDTDS